MLSSSADTIVQDSFEEEQQQYNSTISLTTSVGSSVHFNDGSTSNIFEESPEDKGVRLEREFKESMYENGVIIRKEIPLIALNESVPKLWEYLKVEKFFKNKVCNAVEETLIDRDSKGLEKQIKEIDSSLILDLTLDNPIEDLFKRFHEKSSENATLEKLIEFLENMDRHDVLEDLETDFGNGNQFEKKKRNSNEMIK